VQREGGPCGVLAPVQALLLKYLLFPGDQGAPLVHRWLQGTSEGACLASQGLVFQGVRVLTLGLGRGQGRRAACWVL